MSRDLTATRGRLEAAMIDEARVTRQTKASRYDSATGDLTPRTPTVVYEGALLVTELRPAGGPTSVGGEHEYRSDYQVSVPIDAGPFAIGDEVRLTRCAADPQLVDQLLLVKSITYGTNAARRRLRCRLSSVGPIV